MLMMVYVTVRRHDGDHLGTRSSGPGLLLGGAPFMAFMVMWQFGFSRGVFAKAFCRSKADLATAGGKTPEEANKTRSSHGARAAS